MNKKIIPFFFYFHANLEGMAAASEWATAVARARPDLAASASGARRVSVAFVSVHLQLTDGIPPGSPCVLTVERHPDGARDFVAGDVPPGGDALRTLAERMLADGRILPTPAQFSDSLVDWFVVPAGGLVVAVHLIGAHAPQQRPLRDLVSRRVRFAAHADRGDVAAWLAGDVREAMRHTKATHFVHVMHV